MTFCTLGHRFYLLLRYASRFLTAKSKKPETCPPYLPRILIGGVLLGTDKLYVFGSWPDGEYILPVAGEAS